MPAMRRRKWAGEADGDGAEGDDAVLSGRRSPASSGSHEVRVFGRSLGPELTEVESQAAAESAVALPADRFGGVVFNSVGQVLLLEPKNHFDGYVWTFPKAASHDNEGPWAAARRAVVEESGVTPTILSEIDGLYGGTGTGSTGRYFAMIDTGALPRPISSPFVHQTTWASVTQAADLIDRTKNQEGRRRDASVLRAAACELTFLLSMSSDLDAHWLDWFRLDRPWGMDDGTAVTRTKLNEVAAAEARALGGSAQIVQRPRRPRSLPPPTRIWTEWDMSQLRQGRLDDRGLAFMDGDVLCLNRSMTGFPVFEARLATGPLGWVAENLIVDDETFLEGVGTDLWATTIFEHIVANLLLKKLDEALWRRFFSLTPESC